jgi:L-rhamnose isomerase
MYRASETWGILCSQSYWHHIHQIIELKDARSCLEVCNMYCMLARVLTMNFDSCHVVVPEEKLQELWTIFIRYDRDKKGVIVSLDLFKHSIYC